MTPASLKRNLRSMSTLLSVVLAFVAAGGLAWLVRRYDQPRLLRSTECSRTVDAVFAKQGSSANDADLLKELLLDRDRCLQDPVFVDQARRLMTNLQRSGDARRLLEQAESNRAFKPDELKAQLAWVDAAESHERWANGDESGAKELHDRAMTTANALREKWPEWSLPYRILSEASQSGASPTSYGESPNYYQMEEAVRSRKLNGAWIRSLNDWQPIVFTFLVALLALLALREGVTGFIDAREMSGRTTSSIGSAEPGYVELKGTLHPRTPNTLVIGPLTKLEGVWYEQQYNSGMKKASTQYTRSAESFILRDATGDVIVDPDRITVRTKHSKTRFGNSAGVMNGSRTTEDLLKADDVAFALGELYIKQDSIGAPVKHLRVAQDGRKLLVSNYSESELIWMEKLWMYVGSAVCLLSLLLLAWSFYQRYQVQVAPGVLA